MLHFQNRVGEKWRALPVSLAHRHEDNIGLRSFQSQLHQPVPADQLTLTIAESIRSGWTVNVIGSVTTFTSLGQKRATAKAATRANRATVIRRRTGFGFAGHRVVAAQKCWQDQKGGAAFAHLNGC
jgi:hypothetical protein